MAWNFPVVSFGISVEISGHFIDNNRTHISPQAAANADPAKFLEFADEVARVAAKVRNEQSASETD